MVNGSFVFGMDDDDTTVFDRTVEWAVEQGIETATFHVLTPYPGTALYRRMADAGRITTDNWDQYDTRHAVFQPARMTAAQLEQAIGAPIEQFYRWPSIVRSAWVQDEWTERLRHLAYVGGWKKFEPLWDLMIRAKRMGNLLPVLESVLAGIGAKDPGEDRLRKQVRSIPATVRSRLTGDGVSDAVHIDAADNPEAAAKGFVRSA